METADFSVDPQIDKDLEKRLNSERRNKRKLWTAERVDKYKIRVDETKIKNQNAKELEKSRKRPRRYVSSSRGRGTRADVWYQHATMFVGPFLPEKAFSGGPQIYLNTEPPAPKLDPKTGAPVKSFAEQRDEVRDILMDKMDRRKTTLDKGAGLGNWMDPVVEMGGKIFEQNPFTDELGNISSAAQKGVAGETKYGTPWDTDQDDLTAGAIKRGDVPSDTHSAHRAKDVQRIKFAPQIDKREFAGDNREIMVKGDKDMLQRQRELGPFSGYTEHTTDEISKLSSVRTGYRDTANEAMLKRI